MRVQIGPVSATSVTAWVGYARKALDETVDAPGGDGVWLPDDTVATFVHYLDEWEKAAAGVDEVRWTAEIPADEAEYLSHAFAAEQVCFPVERAWTHSLVTTVE